MKTDKMKNINKHYNIINIKLKHQNNELHCHLVENVKQCDAKMLQSCLATENQYVLPKCLLH